MKKRVLLVTDNHDFRALMKEYLSKGFEVKLSETGEDAYRLIENGYYPDLIISEFTMNLPDGKRFVVKIKSKEKYMNIPLLILSGNDRTVARLDLMRNSSSGYIVKPFSLHDFEERVNRLIEVRA